MQPDSNFDSPSKGYWSEFSLDGINIEAEALRADTFPVCPGGFPPYFWNKGPQKSTKNFAHFANQEENPFPTHRGYSEVRALVGRGTIVDVKNLCDEALQIITQVFQAIKEGSESSILHETTETLLRPNVVRLKLSPDLELWRKTQHLIGNVLPPKGTGLTKVADEICKILGATHWPEAILTNNALFGCGLADFFIGGADAPTMFSNYVTDMVFYYEHGYNHVYPELAPLLEKGLSDPHALRTPGGRERRKGARIGKEYVLEKIALEVRHKSRLSYHSARLHRRTAQIVSIFESSIVGMATEAIARGFDPAACISDLIFSSPGTDVVDVGSDLLNSEVMNSFLNVADITDTGIVSEDVLRRVFDAYAATQARIHTQRWLEPTARMCATLYTWHILNDRHMFFRRAILGWPKARKTPARPQFEADFDEVFDEEYRTTGFSRPLESKYACNGEDTCDQVSKLLGFNTGKPLLEEFWWFLVIGPLDYVRRGEVSEQFEQMLVEGIRLRVVQQFSQGLIYEMIWLIAHATHHAWQVNYLLEAAMFGSILDGGQLIGKLDRKEDDEVNRVSTGA